jgi:hypothetical protein
MLVVLAIVAVLIRVIQGRRARAAALLTLAAASLSPKSRLWRLPLPTHFCEALTIFGHMTTWR